MSQYSGVFISSIVVSLLMSFGCNSKGNKNLSDPDFKRKLRVEYKPKGNINIYFNHKSIPVGNCSKYNISSSLNIESVNEKLKLIDPDKHFYIDRTKQEVCASTEILTLPNSRAAPIGSRAQIVFEDAENTAFAEIEVGATVPNIISINKNLFRPKNLFSQDNRLKEHNFFYIPVGGRSDTFKIKINGKEEYLNSVNEISISVNKDGKDVLLPIHIVPDRAPALFYFSIPPDFPYGSHEVRLYVKDTPTVEQLFTIDVVEKDINLNSTKIKYISILFNNLDTPNVSIPIGKCMDYRVVGKDFNEVMHDISNQDWYTETLSSEGVNFTLFPESMEICAFSLNDRGETHYPEIDQEATFNIEYEEIIGSVTVSAVENPDIDLNGR